MDQRLTTGNRIVQFCSCIAVYLIAVLFAALSAASILQTCRIDPSNPSAEIITFDDDLIFTNLALIGLSVLGALALLRRNISINQIHTKFLVGVMLLVSTIVSLAWVTMVRSTANGEAMTLLNTARDAASNRYGSFLTSYDYYGNYSYYLYYPERLGYVLFAEVIYRIFGAECSPLLFQIPNVIAVDCAYLGLVMIAKALFDRRSVTNLTAIALTVCLQPMFITTYTGSTLLGLAFTVWGVYHVIRYMQNSTIKNAVFAVLLTAVSVLLNEKNIITLTVICIALILHVVNKKKFLALAVAAVMVLCSVGAQKAVIAGYAARSGVKLNTQITQPLYAYMGISDSGMAPGWFNGKAVETLRDNQMDMEKANEAAKQGINNRLTYLTTNHRLFEFYKNKLLSQLNEPSFQSIWISQVRPHDYPDGEKLPAIVESAYTGGLQKVLDNWFNYYTMIIYLSFTAGMIWLIFRKKLNTESLILPLTVLGGVIYHLVFEGKSQYLLPYFMLMIPFAVYGFIESIRALNTKSDFLFK